MKKRYKYILFEQLRQIQNEYNKYWRIKSYLQNFISKILQLTTKIQAVNFQFNERRPSIRRQIDSLRFLGENNSFDERNNFFSILKGKPCQIACSFGHKLLPPNFQLDS